jgi:rfaE bifunctional protein nucleotidyltransferase chain/domain
MELTSYYPSETLETSSKIIDIEQLAQLRTRFAGQRIVHCHGVFDVLHAGHLAYFESARKYGDVLVVTVTADAFVKKGPGRPYFNNTVRARMLAALEVVDFVSVSNFSTAVPLIEVLRPHFYVKGPDYKDKSSDVTGAIFNEEKAAQSAGGKLVFTNDATMSSSQLINEFFNPWTDHQQKTIAEIKSVGGYDHVLECLHNVSKLSALIVGEPIVDTYVFCQPEAISSKSPSISARYNYQEDYAGGSLAIVNHISDFVREATLLTTHGNEAFFCDLLKTEMDPNVELKLLTVQNCPTPRKTRFIEQGRSQRIFELTNLRSDQWETNNHTDFCRNLRHLNSVVVKQQGLTLLADFGHGLFERQILLTCQELGGFIALNAQTNSSNFGFNPFTKHKKFNYLSIDTREARLAYHDRYSSALDLARMIRKDLGIQQARSSITLGSMGAIYFPHELDQEIETPAFSDAVIDATGAGDAYFLMSSLLIRSGAPNIFVPFIANVFAGLKTKIIGNKTKVSKSQLIKAMSAILK